MARSEPLYRFPIYRAGQSLFCVQTLNRQLEDYEVQFAKFDKKAYRIRITDCTYDG